MQNREKPRQLSALVECHHRLAFIQIQALPLQSEKKHAAEAFGKATRVIGELKQLARGAMRIAVF